MGAAGAVCGYGVSEVQKASLVVEWEAGGKGGRGWGGRGPWAGHEAGKASREGAASGQWEEVTAGRGGGGEAGTGRWTGRRR